MPQSKSIYLFIILAITLSLSGHGFAQSTPAKVTPHKPALDIQVITSPKYNLTAWLVEDHSVPIIALEFAFQNAGSAQDTPEKQGLARLLSNTLDEGAADLTSQDFQQQLNDNSISLFFQSSRDNLTGSLKTLTRNQDIAFDLLRKAISAPRFDEKPVERMKEANRSRILGAIHKPEWAAARLINDIAFTGHPYALNSGGTLSTLSQITPYDLKAFYKKALAKDNLRIAVAGDITAQQLERALDKIFADLPDHNALQEVADTTIQHQGQTFLFEQDIPQTIIQMIQPGISIHDPNYHNAQIINFILGSSGFGSRLMKSIREERGLTYGVYTDLLNYRHTNAITVGTSTKNETAKETINLIKQGWQDIIDRPITKTELDTAKTFLLGQLPLSLTSTDKIAAFVLSINVNDLPVDYLDQRQAAIQNATIETLQPVAKDLLSPKKLTTVLVGKPASIGSVNMIKTLPNVE